MQTPRHGRQQESGDHPRAPRRQWGVPPPPDETPPRAPASDESEMEMETECEPALQLGEAEGMEKTGTKRETDRMFLLPFLFW